MNQNHDKPHIVVLCLDTVRKDYYDQYAPRLRDLATVKFEGMRALSSWSVPSHAGMLTGKVPSEIGVHANQRRFDTIDTSDTWLSRLTKRGYGTFCVSANVYASSAFGFDKFFDKTVSVSPSRRFPEGMDIQQYIMERDEEGLKSYLSFIKRVLSHDHPLQSLLNGILLKIDDVSTNLPVQKPFDYGGSSMVRILKQELHRSETPKLAFANVMDAHGPHTPFRGLDGNIHDVSGSFDSTNFKDWDVTVAERLGEYEYEVEQVRQLYRAEIDYLDRILSELIREVMSEVERDVVFIVTADHGENLGYEDDEFMMNHVSSLSEALLHVPFDIILPEKEGVTSIDGLASHEDMGEIVMSLERGEPLTQFKREVARAEIVGSGSGFPEGGDEKYWNRGQRVLYFNGFKYYQDDRGSEAVYEISEDPSVCRKLPDEPVPDGLFEKYFPKWVSEETEVRYDEELDEATQSRLEELGYL